MRPDENFNPLVGSEESVKAELARLEKERELALQEAVNQGGNMKAQEPG